jgi:hypothetical protein
MTRIDGTTRMVPVPEQPWHRLVRRTMMLAVTVFATAACEHPLAVVTPHIEAADLELRDSTGVLLARTEFNRSWTADSLVIIDGQPLRLVITPLDFRGQPVETAERGDISFRMEAENGALVQWEPQRGFGWVRPFAVGATRVRFLIWHETHADFVTPWLPVRVQAAPVSASHSRAPATVSVAAEATP